jgi:flagella basal body P-ring formation protein FlgA
MTSTLGRKRSSDTARDPGGDTPVVSLSAPTKRRPSWVLGGVVLVGLAALLGAYVFASVTDTLQVTVAANDLEPGEVIEAGDLRVVEMGRTGDLRAILADQQDLIIGQSPRALIPAGTLLNTGLFVAADDVVPAGQVVVGAAFSAGEVPTPNLAAGERVAMLAVRELTIGASTSEDRVEADVLGEATVWSVTGEAAADGGTSDRVWVALLVSEDLQAAVAQSAADGRLRLSLLGS